MLGLLAHFDDFGGAELHLENICKQFGVSKHDPKRVLVGEPTNKMLIGVRLSTDSSSAFGVYLVEASKES